VGDVVLDWDVRSRDLGEGRELRQQVEVGVGVVLGADGRAGGDIWGEDTLYLQVCVWVNEFTYTHVNQEVKVSEEIGTEDGLLDICNDEYPQ